MVLHFVQGFAKVCKNSGFLRIPKKFNALNNKRFLKLRHDRRSEKGSSDENEKIRKARTGAAWRGVAAKITFAHFCTTAPKKDGKGEGKTATSSVARNGRKR
ncbi:hypothetical protein AB2K75_000545 [Escherichia coli]|uniref:hypothetical protein n=1 Tax=Escherichia coli TaxID=562 RepID=UPI0006D0C119|nr:hypothetical protein [Escherichia coli]EEQ2060382.1 hypothetical protein [Escherichia coli]EFC5051747.1 hypothetical protein [Escherichia coli]EFK2621315.1 hypothetical protein [Escherichia coli]EFM5951384.1 hypothetical protein [Escherichia coli]EII7684044.1 hypothetical protein [Escherichia coli]